MRMKSHSHNSFLRPACPEIHSINRIARRNGADEGKADFNIARSGDLLYDIEQLQGHQFCSLYTRAGWCTQANLKLTGINSWKQFHSELWIYEPDGHGDNNDVSNKHYAIDPHQ